MAHERPWQEDIADIKSTTEEIQAAIRYLVATQADFEAIHTERVESALDSVDRKLQSFLQQMNKQETVVTLLGKTELMDSLSMAVKRELRKELAEYKEGSTSASCCKDWGTHSKEPLLPETESKGTKRLMCLPCGCLPLNDFSEKYQQHLEERVQYKKEEQSKTSFSPSLHTNGVRGKLYQNLKVDGRVGNKPCLITVDTGASITIIRSDIAVGLPERRLPTMVYLQCMSGRTIPVFKEALAELTLGKRKLKLWVNVADITEEFSLGLDVMYVHDVVVDLKRHILRLDDEEVPLRRPGIVPCTFANGKIARDRCETVKAERLNQSLDEVIGLGQGGFLSRHSR
jgi:hypothetical protein